MGAKISFKNTKNYRGEKISDILIKSTNNLKAINCPTELNSSAIDEFLIIFLAASKAKGISYFKNVSELNKPIIIKDYLKDHRIFMMSTIAALTCGGDWKIHDIDSINTSFPSFLKIIKKISNKTL